MAIFVVSTLTSQYTSPMAPSLTSTKLRILSAAYDLFYSQGFARVSMDAIAEATGVTKRTLYYHYESKDALAAAVLENQHFHAFGRIKKWGGASVESPAEFLSGLFDELERWVSSADWQGSGFTRLTMELADLPGHPIRSAAHRHKAEVETWLCGELLRLGVKNPESLARQVMLLIEGALSLMLIHRDRAYISAAAQAAQRLVNARDQGGSKSET